MGRRVLSQMASGLLRIALVVFAFGGNAAPTVHLVCHGYRVSVGRGLVAGKSLRWQILGGSAGLPIQGAAGPDRLRPPRETSPAQSSGSSTGVRSGRPRTPPAPLVTDAPPKLTGDGSALFRFRDAGPYTGFECQLDGDPLRSCDSGHAVYWAVTVGQHCFSVWAMNDTVRSKATIYCWRWRPSISSGWFSIENSPLDDFYPGFSQAIDLRITNAYNVPIFVSSVSVAVAPYPTKGDKVVQGCPAQENMIVTRPFSGGVVVPAKSTSSLSQLGVPSDDWPVVMMPDLNSDQDACLGATFLLTYQGEAAQR